MNSCCGISYYEILQVCFLGNMPVYHKSLNPKPPQTLNPQIDSSSGSGWAFLNTYSKLHKVGNRMKAK